MLWFILLPIFSFFGKIIIERLPLFLVSGNKFWQLTWNGRKSHWLKFMPFCANDQRLIFDIILFICFVLTQDIFAIFLGVALVVCWVDYKCAHLPEDIIMPFFLLGLLGSPMGLLDSVIGCTLGYVVMRTYMEIISYKDTSNYSGGDITFMLMAGSWLGSNVVWALLLTPFLFIVEGYFRKTLKSSHPMRPSLFLSSFVIAVCLTNGINIWSFVH